MRPRLSTETLLSNQRDRVMRYCSSILGKKFGIPVELDQQAANAIAIATICGRGSEIWLDGNLQSLNGLKLSITLQSQTEPEKD